MLDEILPLKFFILLEYENPNTTWIFIFQMYGKSWSILLGHFIKHILFPSEELGGGLWKKPKTAHTLLNWWDKSISNLEVHFLHSDAVVEADGVMFENNILSDLKKVDTTTETAEILGRVWVRHLENLPLFRNLLT